MTRTNVSYMKGSPSPLTPATGVCGGPLFQARSHLPLSPLPRGSSRATARNIATQLHTVPTVTVPRIQNYKRVTRSATGRLLGNYWRRRCIPLTAARLGDALQTAAGAIFTAACTRVLATGRCTAIQISRAKQAAGSGRPRPVAEPCVIAILVGPGTAEASSGRLRRRFRRCHVRPQRLSAGSLPRRAGACRRRALGRWMHAE